jgi:hypothetical protein
MKPLLKAELSQLLSAYVDGELDDQQARLVEEIIATDARARQELEELRALKNLVAQKTRLPASVGLWTRVASEIERRKKEEENLLPFPRRYFPVVAGAVAVLVVAVGVLLYQQRASVVDYVNKQSELVQKTVVGNVLKGSIMPLFSRVDKNQALQFAMFGTLPLDAKAETEFRVNEDSARGYTIDVERKRVQKPRKVTVEEFVEEIRPTRIQREIIDSLLDLGREKLEGSVFVAEDKAMAIDPQLSRLNRVMLSGIAAALEPEQRTRFEKFLRVRSAPYMISGGGKQPESSERILHTMRVVAESEPYLVVTADTVVMSSVQLDKDSLRKHFQRVSEDRERVMINMNGFIRRIAEQRVDLSRQHVVMPAPHVQVYGNSEFLSIQFGDGMEKMSVPMPDLWVKPRYPGQRGTAGRPRISTSIAGDSSFLFNFRFDDSELDSIVERMMKMGVPSGFESMVERKEGTAGTRRIDASKLKRALDSAFLAKKDGRSKLDSLMREMDRRELRRAKDLKEKNDKE